MTDHGDKWRWRTEELGETGYHNRKVKTRGLNGTLFEPIFTFWNRAPQIAKKLHRTQDPRNPSKPHPNRWKYWPQHFRSSPPIVYWVLGYLVAWLLGYLAAGLWAAGLLG